MYDDNNRNNIVNERPTKYRGYNLNIFLLINFVYPLLIDGKIRNPEIRKKYTRQIYQNQIIQLYLILISKMEHNQILFC